MAYRNSINFLSDVAEDIALAITTEGLLPPEAAEKFAQKIVKGVQKRWWGVSIYISNEEAQEIIKERHERIWAAFKREGYSDSLGRRHNLSDMRVRQIIKHKRQENSQKAIQTMLPLEDVS